MIYIIALLTACYLLFNIIIALAMRGVYMGKRSALYWILFVIFGMPIVILMAIVLIPMELVKEWKEND